MPNLAHFGNYFLPSIGIFWHANLGIDPKLAETAPLLYRVTDAPFLPKMEQEPKLAETNISNYWKSMLLWKLFIIHV